MSKIQSQENGEVTQDPKVAAQWATDKNPPAFPGANPGYDGNWDKRMTVGGMSLRDWFAGKALVGVIVELHSTQYSLDIELCAMTAYRLADKMLDARAIPQPDGPCNR